MSHPTTHAWVLNLYRAGEHHPQTVTDYFPYEHAPSEHLREKVKRHAGDERRHTALYTRAIKKLGFEPFELHGHDVFNQVIRDCTPCSFAIADGDKQDVKTEKLANFLAHAHCLERRIARSLDFHQEACERSGSKDILKVVTAVHADEDRHLTYTKEAVYSLLPKSRANEVFALHSQAEAAADKAFSAFQVRNFQRLHGKHLSLPKKLFYKACAFLMEASQ